MRPTDSVLTDAQMSRAAGTLIACLALFGLVGILGVWVISPDELRPNYHVNAVLALAAGAVVIVLMISRVPGLITARRIPFGLAAAAAGVAATCWLSGPRFGPYVAMSFLWIGMFAHLFLTRVTAFALIGWVAVLYGLVLAFQPGNSGPVTRFILVIGAVNVSGLLVGALADRIHELVDAERASRLEVEEASGRLEEASRQRREFLAGMSHELRTPLNAIIGFADVLTEGLFGPLTAGQQGQVDTIRAAGGRLLGLVGEVLALDAPDPDLVRVGGRAADPPAAEREPLIRADPRGAVAFFLLAPLALATLPTTPRGLHIGAIAVFAAAGLAIDMFVLLSPRVSADIRATAHVTLVTLVAFAIALNTGSELSPFATMFFLWMAVAASIRLSARAAVLQLVLISACEALIVTFQPGNAAPLFRWEITTATACVSAVVMRIVVDRLFDAADAEAHSAVVADATRAALEGANRHKVEFLRNVRTELRWPADEVTSAITALLAGGDGGLSAKQTEYARDIAGAGDQLWSLITDILDLATLESGAMTLEITEVAVFDVIHDALADDAVAADEGGIGLEVDVVPSGARVWTDGDKLRRSVAGLVSNAVKFTPGGGRVTVRARIDARHVVISVADTGRGIPLEDQSRIFDGFQQGRSAMVAPGVGVGLTLARRFVELQGGMVELESQPGVGSTFTITLPVFERPTSAPREAPVA